MAELNRVFNLKQGAENQVFYATVLGSDGRAADLTGWSARIRVKLPNEDADFIINEVMDIEADQSQSSIHRGRVYYTFTLADTQNAIADYDVEIETEDANGVKAGLPMTEGENFGILRIRKSFIGQS